MSVLERCGDKFLKYLFGFFTLVLFLIGICAIGIGIWAIADKSFVEIVDLNIPELNAHKLRSAAILLIIVGLGIMVVGFLGCCGAAKENRCLLVSFFICLLLVFVLMIAGAIMAGGYQDILKKLLDKGLAEMKTGYEKNAEVKNSVDTLEQEFKCCLFNATEKGHESCYPPTATTVAPAGNSTANSTAAPAPKPEPYKANCADAVMKKVNDLMDRYKVRIVGIGVASAVIVLIGMIVSMALCCKIQRGYSNVE